MRNEICEDNDVHCLAFTTPLMDFGGHYDEDYDDGIDEDLKQFTSIVKSKKNWNKIY